MWPESTSGLRRPARTWGRAGADRWPLLPLLLFGAGGCEQDAATLLQAGECREDADCPDRLICMLLPGMVQGRCGCRRVEEASDGGTPEMPDPSARCSGGQRCDELGRCRCTRDQECPELLFCSAEGSCRCRFDSDCRLPAPDTTAQPLPGACYCREGACSSMDERGDVRLCPLRERPINLCGGRTPLPHDPGEPGCSARCGAQPELYTWQCAGPDELVCRGPHLGEELNACGGCRPLPGDPGQPCGDCAGWIWSCDPGDPERLDCLPAASGLQHNLCGGCPDPELDRDWGQPCSIREEGPACGTWVCDGPQALYCLDEGSDGCGVCRTGLEPAQGCTERPGPQDEHFFRVPGDTGDQLVEASRLQAGGACSAGDATRFCGRIFCEPEEATRGELPAGCAQRQVLRCNDQTGNPCGTCEPILLEGEVLEGLPAQPGQPCGRNGAVGTWECSQDLTRLVCRESLNRNSCGGQRLLPGVAGESCAHCMVWTCVPGNRETLECRRRPPLATGGEICDGLDNDCDGLVDTDDPDLEPPPATVQTGVCRGATRRCEGPDGWLEPDYTRRPHHELRERSCDRLDNDCDGLIDSEDPDLRLVHRPASEQRGVCAGTRQICVPEGWVDPDFASLPGHEEDELSCDGLDNDCDGTTDEGSVRTECGVGECKRIVAGCFEGVPPPCIPGTPRLELCDLQDNDCDGKTDELGTVTCGKGICQITVPLCVDGQLQECRPGLGVLEECSDQLDNDCDGRTDGEDDDCRP